MTYTTQKVGRTRTNILDASGELVCQLLNKEVAGWLRSRARAEAEEAAFQIERRAYRTELAREYLTRRAVREAAAPKQMELF